MINNAPQDSRLAIYPIHRQSIWNCYTRQRRAFWIPAEIDFDSDRGHYESCDDTDKRILEILYGIFTSFDGLVNYNTAAYIKDAFGCAEVNVLLNFQMMMEDIHGEVYSEAPTAAISDPVKRASVLNAITDDKMILKIADWVRAKMSDPNATIVDKVYVGICVEGILFVFFFCIIYWFQSRNLMPGLAHANRFIAADEGQHVESAEVMLREFGLLQHLTQDKAYSVIDELMELLQEMADYILPVRRTEMNADLMMIYVRSVADVRLNALGFTAKYGDKCPFSFMQKNNMLGKSNIFEARNNEYAKESANGGDLEFTMDF